VTGDWTTEALKEYLDAQIVYIKDLMNSQVKIRDAEIQRIDERHSFLVDRINLLGNTVSNNSEAITTLESGEAAGHNTRMGIYYILAATATAIGLIITLLSVTHKI